MINRFRKTLLAVALLAASAGAVAEDIDLFVGAESLSGSDYPNVIILLDNSANWAAQSQQWPDGSAQGESELRAIKRVVSGLAPANEDAKVNIGLMMLNEGSGQIPDGGYVRSRVMEMTWANRVEFIRKIDHILANFQDPSEKVSSSVGYDRAMFEVFKYFGGHTRIAEAYSDIEGGSQPRNSTHFGSYRYSGDAVFAKRDPLAFADLAQTTYKPAAPTEEVCKAKNYVILIGNGWPGPTESDAATLLRNVGEDPTQQIYPTSSSDVRYADEMARFMYQTDVSPAPGFQNVVTYTIDVYNAKPSAAHEKLLRSMGDVGGGGYFAATNEDAIAVALQTALSEIKSVSSVFASVSLPVSVNTQGTYLNQVFVGMFRPDENALPRWAGNLKQYKMGLSGGELVLQDADGASAINSSTGFVTECARSFWTPKTTTPANYWGDATLPYWSKVPEGKAGGCMAVSGSAQADYPDGNVVEKGAQGYKLRTGGSLLLANATTRNVLACTQSDCTTPPAPAVGLLDQFDTSHSVTAAELGATVTATERTALINWARGADAGADSEFSDGRVYTTTSTMRPSVHGDVVHSRPVAINFGSDTSKEVVVFYGGNDGLLRAVNGNRDGEGAIGGLEPGRELWSFMPPEFYPHIKRIRDNEVGIDFPNFPVVTGLPTPEPKRYGFDGPVTAHKDSSDAWLYAAMRRGGRALYAFDVDNPASPSLKWRIGCPSPDVASDTGCTTGLSDIGQTWSSAKPFLAQGYEAGAAPLLIMGGGYDVCEDFDNGTQNHNCSASSKGNQIYILDADSGDVVRAFETERGVVGDVTLVTGSNGMTQYAYAADLGGNVYRITIGESTEDNWSMTRIAALGCDSLASCNANRKFMFAPDVVVDGNTYYVLVGSGDREKPLENNDEGVASAATTVANHFYMVRDIPTDTNWLSSERSTCSVPDGEPSVICLDSLYPIGATADSPTESVVNTKKGWYLELRNDEQVVTSAITVYGVVTFSTHIPEHYQPGQCPTLGTASVYNIDYTNAKSLNGTGLRFEEIAGGGLPPSPVAGMVTLDDGTTVPFVIGSNPESPLQGGEAPAPNVAGQPRAKVYWNIEDQQDPLP
ncbi:type IV pilus assembly protein PilY1 [Geopseudomonas sagittaria]|uniref:Type IV pilus assembly protein PilY1 n=1 Tax=Geopseudomonas sagittaria TaxID=1135990 RepID=A0A1I5UXG0_9GAMM|nr:PilC/PilY family type IV pilus protein [Pseudomonas sagittaria]SFP99899.1 type IV pilus assembly protein PilY1 [Pseudomonas sagittaria]